MLFSTSGPNLVILTWMGDELWSRQAQNGVNSDFEVKYDLEGLGQLPPKNNRDLNQGLLHLWSKFGDPSLNGPKLSCGQASDWHTQTHGHTHTHGHTQTQAMAIPEGQNWPLVKIWIVGFFPHLSCYCLYFGMLMHPDHLQNWLDVGHRLLIFLILAAFWLSETGQICRLQTFSWETWDEWPEICHDDASWSPWELVRFRSRFPHLPHCDAIWLSETGQMSSFGEFLDNAWEE